MLNWNVVIIISLWVRTICVIRASGSQQSGRHVGVAGVDVAFRLDQIRPNHQRVPKPNQHLVHTGPSNQDAAKLAKNSRCPLLIPRRSTPPSTRPDKCSEAREQSADMASFFLSSIHSNWSLIFSSSSSFSSSLLTLSPSSIPSSLPPSLFEPASSWISAVSSPIPSASTDPTNVSNTLSAGGDSQMRRSRQSLWCEVK